ncbi:MAG: pyridoxamine 5'-phosphate oxidase family protein, partial [Vicinamibacterales bacterium]|nr:pyridoxamine 5'-phosphate oxidase family protein [Vicinamibacterales bacterium]
MRPSSASRVPAGRRVGRRDTEHGSGEDLGRTIRRLLDGQRYGVLCTQGQGQPYGSLVAYATTPDLDSAVFATQKATRKYRLLSECAPDAIA